MVSSKGLNEKLKELIAKEEGIDPKEITLEYIEERRKVTNYYVRYPYANYASYSKEELDRLEERVTSWIKEQVA